MENQDEEIIKENSELKEQLKSISSDVEREELISLFKYS